MYVSVKSEMYNVCRIYKKAQLIKNLSEIVFHKDDMFVVTLKLSKMCDFLRESGDFIYDGQKGQKNKNKYWLSFTVSVKFYMFTTNKMLFFFYKLSVNSETS